MADDNRALLTEREQEILSDNADVSQNYYHRVVARVRNKIRRLEQDLELLSAHDAFKDELREVLGETALKGVSETEENTGDQSDSPTTDSDTSKYTSA